MLVGPGKHLLKDILGIGLAQPEALGGDGIDIAREALHEQRPRTRLPSAACPDQISIAYG
jgi:hypothetical protein